jgi:hypothetical protein
VVGRGPSGAGEVCELWACLEQGVCPTLQELDLHKIYLPGKKAARCLRQGLPGCPDLRRLRLFLHDDQTLVALAAALEQGLYPKLEALIATVSPVFFNWNVHGGEVFAAALRAFPRPGLQELDLQDFQALAPGLVEALRSGVCRGLTRLSLEAKDFKDLARMEDVPEALATCPHLREFTLEFSSERNGDTLCRALAEAVREGTLPCLDHLTLLVGGVTDDNVRALAEALGARGGRLVHYKDRCAKIQAEKEMIDARNAVNRV